MKSRTTQSAVVAFYAVRLPSAIGPIIFSLVDSKLPHIPLNRKR